MKNYKDFASSLSEDERMARADFKVGPSGRKSHKEIVFKDGSAEQEDEKKEVKEEVELEEATDTVVKDKTGKIISFKHEGDWKKANPKKNPEGQIHNLAGKALQKAKNLNKEEVELEENAPVAPGLVKHRIGVTVSDPNATSVTARKEKIQKFVRVTHSSNKEGAQKVGEKHFKKKGYVVHDSWHAGVVNEETISESDHDPWHDAQENKKSADAAKKQGDTKAYHMHMADHHENMAHWSMNRGRHAVANQHQMKADQHHDWAHGVKEAVELEEGYVVRYHNPKSEKHGSEKHFADQSAAQKHADRGNSIDKIGGKYTVHKTNEKGHDIKEQTVDFDQEGNLMAEKKTYAQFVEQLLEYTPGPGGVTRHVGTYGTAKGAKYGNTNYDDEHMDKNDDEGGKKTEPAVKRGRGRPAGSKSGANQKVTSGKSFGGFATHSLHLPNTNK